MAACEKHLERWSKNENSVVTCYILVSKICTGKFIFASGVRKTKNMELFFFYHGKINVNLQIQSTANADRILACRQVL